MRRGRIRPILGVLLTTLLVIVLTWSGVASGGLNSWNAAPLTGSTASTTAVTVSGTGCVGSSGFVILSQGSNVNSLPGVVNQVFLADITGNWNGILNVPAGLTPGTYTLWAQCVSQFNYPNFAFQIAAPVPPDAPVPDPVVAPASFTG